MPAARGRRALTADVAELWGALAAAQAETRALLRLVATQPGALGDADARRLHALQLEVSRLRALLRRTSRRYARLRDGASYG